MKRLRGLALAGLGGLASAQMPEPWRVEPQLGAGTPAGPTWYGAGLWAADKHGPPATFVQSRGLGNALLGTGVSLEAGRASGAWDLAGKVILYRDPDGTARGDLEQGHLRYTSSGGWRWGFEQEPLVWGYGLNGGYTLGEAARPVPKFRVESSFRERSLLGIPLGAWKGEFFWGRLEARRTLGENVQDPSFRRRQLGADPQGPFLTGYRAEARFGDSLEFYLNWVNLFGGSVGGVSMTRGYGLGDWLTAMVGAKDALAEGSNSITDPALQSHDYHNKARSASSSDVGMRFRSRPMERLLGAQDVRFYITRGSKAVNIIYGAAFRQPLYTLGQDLQMDWRAVRDLDPGRIWKRKARYWAPSPEVPNDVIGVLLAWERFRLGLEYLDTSNRRGQFEELPGPNGHRSFVHGLYLTGFYHHGDALGTALGGEAKVSTLRAEWDLGSAWTAQTWLHFGQRPYMDRTEDWLLDHPGRAPVDTSFWGLQQCVSYQGRSGFRLRGGASYQYQSAVAYQQGVAGNGFRWLLELGWRWSGPGGSPTGP